LKKRKEKNIDNKEINNNLMMDESAKGLFFVYQAEKILLK
jgi:hypothetical protein